MVGALRWPTRPWIPIEAGLPSVKARAGSWQVLQATVPSADRRPSKNSLWPRAIFSGVCGLSGGIAARVAAWGTPTCRRDLGRANGPASGMGGAFRVACCVAASRGASATEPACLRAPWQPRISVAAPTSSIIVTHNRVRFATRIPQLSSLDGALFFGRFFPFHAPCKALLGPGFARVTIIAGGTFSPLLTRAIVPPPIDYDSASRRRAPMHLLLQSGERD